MKKIRANHYLFERYGAKVIFSIQPKSLFARTAISIATVLIVFELIVLAITSRFVGLPLAQRSATDMANLIHLLAEQWQSLPMLQRQQFEQRLLLQYGFEVQSQRPLPTTSYYLPYIRYLQTALSQRFAHPITITSTKPQNQRWFWLALPVKDEVLVLRFARSRIGTRLTVMSIAVIIVNIMVVLGAAFILARRLTKPLASLSSAARRIGQGQFSQVLPEVGSTELAELVNTFNQMSQQLNQLLNNRTTLLAGISHDLRTPIARMGLAVEMLDQQDEELVAQLRRDLAEMTQLLAQFLEFSRGLKSSQEDSIDIRVLLLDCCQQQTIDINTDDIDTKVMTVNQLALQRIVNNCLENAIRYGEPPIVVKFNHHDQVIRIIDHGTGIAETELTRVFEPFYRVEASRNRNTGGYGLGLAIVQDIAHANGWHVCLLNRALGGLEARIELIPTNLV